MLLWGAVGCLETALVTGTGLADDRGDGLAAAAQGELGLSCETLGDVTVMRMGKSGGCGDELDGVVYWDND